MKATIATPPPPPIEITLTMSERDARILTAFIGLHNGADWENKLRKYFNDVKDILPSNFDPKIDPKDDIGYRLYNTMTNILNKIGK